MKKTWLILSMVLLFVGVVAIATITSIYYVVVYIGHNFDLTWSMIIHATSGGKFLWYGGLLSLVMSLISFAYSLRCKA